MEQVNFLNNSGMLKVSGGHHLYWEDWGNKQSKVPIFYLHGGPGEGFKAKDGLMFDPKNQRIIFYDQRGSGKSRPYASLKNNTTQDLVDDIDRIRKHLNIGVIHLAGGSWGSTLALNYATANPEVVQKMLLWGIFLGREEDINYLYQGEGHKFNFPDVWQRYVDMVPQMERSNIAAYYTKQLEHRDPAVRQRYVNEWLLYENSLLEIDSKIERKILESDLKDDPYALAFAKLEAHYGANKYFMSENHLLKNAKVLRHIPIILVHGRFDFVCPLSGAFELQKEIGDNSYLHIVPAGHARSDAVYREVVKAYARSFLLS